MAFSASASPELRFSKIKPDGHTKPIEKQKKRQAVKSRMDANKKKAKDRDGRKCRWHEPHTCFMQLESDHVLPLGMGGDPLGIRSETSNLYTACHGIHQAFDESLHNGRIWVEGLTPEMCDGPLRGMRKTPAYDRERNLIGYDVTEVWREIAVGRVEKAR